MLLKTKTAAHNGSSLLDGEKLGELMPILGYNSGHYGGITTCNEDLDEMLR